jgi:hypothetical protein
MDLGLANPGNITASWQHISCRTMAVLEEAEVEVGLEIRWRVRVAISHGCLAWEASRTEQKRTF